MAGHKLDHLSSYLGQLSEEWTPGQDVTFFPVYHSADSPNDLILFLPDNFNSSIFSFFLATYTKMYKHPLREEGMVSELG